MHYIISKLREKSADVKNLINIDFVYPYFKLCVCILQLKTLGKIGVLLVYSLSCFSQVANPDTVHLLKTVNVVDFKARYTLGENTLDSTYFKNSKNNNLADLLHNQSQSFIKSYGPGSLASISLRGGSASQTAIVWNGFNLQSPMIGQTDLSLIPVFLIDEVNVQPNATSTRWGSGAVSGIVELNNKSIFNKGLLIRYNTNVSSFHSFFNGLTAHYSNQKFSNATRIFYSTAKNDFPFVNIAKSEKPIQIQEHAGLRQWGFLQENAFKINERNILSLKYWQQLSDRELPPIMLQALSKATQHDQNTRTVAEWKHVDEKFEFYVRSGYFNETINYTDSLTHIFTHSNSQNYLNEVGYTVNVNDVVSFNSLLNYTYTKASGDGYLGGHSQKKLAFGMGAALRSRNKKCTAFLNYRQEVVDDAMIQPALSGSLKYNLFSIAGVELDFSKNYRLPTFNDLYWVPGGNEKLLPEQSTNESVGIFVDCIKDKFSIHSSVSLFNRNTTNWIIWLPQGSLWMPQNILQVWSRGVDQKFTTGFRKKNWSVKIIEIYNYVLSTNEKEKTVNDGALNKQLIYTPIHKVAYNLQIQYKALSCIFLQQYTGLLYVTSDNSDWIGPYTTADWILNYELKTHTFAANLIARVNNIWNTNYQVIAWRPMPGRNYLIGLTLTLTKNESK